MKKNLKYPLLGILILTLLFFGYLFIGSSPQAAEIKWGVNFSQKHARDLGLDWQGVYLALFNDLKVKNIKLISHWDLLEPAKDKYYFDDLDWQIKEAEERNAKILLVIGMKTGRWPECHIPEWAQDLSKREQQEEILGLIESIVLKYRDSKAIDKWQVENEPFFPFGLCPWKDKKFVKKEIELVKSLDARKRPVVITDSGELSLWIQAAKLGDIVGATMYRKAWVKELGIYADYPFNQIFYRRKAQLINKLFGKKVIVVELQAEPWGSKLLYDSPRQEQQRTMGLEQFSKNIEFAKGAGFSEFYLWGAEWWYWLKEKFPEQEDAILWEEAKKLFSHSF